MCSLTGRGNGGSCVGARQPKWMSLFAPPASKRSIWKSINGECSRFRLHAVNVKRSKAFVVSAGLSALFLLPYMSIDFFFVVAPFLCRTDLELSVIAKRIAAAIIVAGICFLAFPL